MINIRAIDHIVLRTVNEQALIQFYCEVLGCHIEHVAPEFGLIQLRAGNALIDIVDVSGPIGQSGGAAPKNSGNHIDHFCLQIETFDETDLLDYLDAHGVEHECFNHTRGAQGMGRSIYIKDSDGNKVELRAAD